MSIVLITNYSRSGGTILSKCLASLENTVLISEVNPGGYFSVKDQAKKWYSIELKYDTYFDAVMELYEVCNKTNKRLIIRDWTFIDFTPHTLNNYQPIGKFSNMELLNKKVNIQPIAFIRDAIDIWISRWMPPDFFPYYKNYTQELIINNIPLFKYEDFCEDQEVILKAICNKADLDFSDNYKNYLRYDNVTGDNMTSVISRGKRSEIISPLKRRKIPNSVIKELNKNIDMIAANTIMQYPINYFDKQIDEKDIKILIELKHQVKKILRISTKDQY
jgi:hypothetical protein